jgi:hypothetical protein
MLARLMSFTIVAVLACLPSDGLEMQSCPFLHVTGIPCPFCGITRSLSSFLHLEFAKSVSYHPLGLPVLACFAMVIWSGSVHVNIARFNLDLTSNRVQITVLALFFVIWFIRLGLSSGDFQ